MEVKLITAIIMVAACMIVHAKTAALKSQDSDVAAVFVEDSNTGQLRFLGNGFGNDQINQLITNKQNFLEQLRPGDNSGGGIDITTQTDGGGTATDTVTGTDIDTITNTGTTIGNGEGTTTTGVSPAAGIRVRPIVISANGVNSNRRRKLNRRRRRGNKGRRDHKHRRGNKPRIIIIRRS